MALPRSSRWATASWQSVAGFALAAGAGRLLPSAIPSARLRGCALRRCATYGGRFRRSAPVDDVARRRALGVDETSADCLARSPDARAAPAASGIERFDLIDVGRS
jgi:hypothetical protein